MSCFVSDDRQCIYSDSDGADPLNYPDGGDCAFGITLDNVVTTTVGSFDIFGVDQLRVLSAVEGQPDFLEPSIGPINVEADKDTVWVWEDEDVGTAQGWTICIQELDLTMNAALGAGLVNGAEPSALLNAVDQTGLSTGYTSGTTIYQTYIGGVNDHSLTDTDGFVSDLTDLAEVEFDVAGAGGITLSHFAFWPNDGVEMGLDFEFSNIDCATSTALDFTRSFSTPYTFVPSGGPINAQLVRIPRGVENVRCVRMRMTNCNDADGIGGTAVPCSFGEIAFLSPDLAIGPVTPP